MLQHNKPNEPDALDKARSHPLYKEWLTEQKELQQNGVPAHECLPFQLWLKLEYPKKVEARKQYELTHTRDILITNAGVVTFEYPNTAHVATIHSKLLALAEQSVDLLDYQSVLGIKIISIDAPKKKRIGFIDV